ncbi:MAG: adenosylhomocysteinase [Actinomycetota bacterium]|nr:adenosylhomocysteinase [Actinomycetota bacterium]
MQSSESIVKDSALAPEGHKKIDWAAQHSPVLNVVRDKYLKDGSFEGLGVGVALPIEAKTAYLTVVLAEAGADVAVASPSPYLIQDDVAAALAARGVTVYASSESPPEEADRELEKVLDRTLGDGKPAVLIDDRAGLVRLAHTTRRTLLEGVRGASEETTTGVAKFRAMEREGVLEFPVIIANEARCKHRFDNRYGTGQSTLTAIMQNTNLMVGGKRVVVLGYGWCGKGIARYAAGLGARVTVCEVDPVLGLEAYADGFDVLPALEAAEVGEVFITATGSRDVLTAEHFQRMRDGALLANAGAVDEEIDTTGLRTAAWETREVRRNVEEFTMPDGRKLYLVGHGMVVNLTAGDGHPVEIMDLTFAIQALCAHHLAKEHERLGPTVYLLPKEIDDEVARIKLNAVGMGVDALTSEQEEFLLGWRD